MGIVKQDVGDAVKVEAIVRSCHKFYVRKSVIYIFQSAKLRIVGSRVFGGLHH